MKKFYYLIVVLLGHSSFAQNFTDTKGELQISTSGTAVYTLPIAIPPSIKNVAPVINLVYSSGIRGGIAGQGWSINSISAVSRIATRRDIDGFVDGVDFDANDKLALDGQRLLIKTGTYWANGSTYETEYKSNTKIELKIEGTTTYFIVTAPDGSRSWYGSKGSGSLQNSVSVNSWYIVRFEDVYGNFIDYNYKTVTYNSTNQLYIDTIVFSGNTIAGIAAQDKIAFNYEAAKRIERDYLKGVPIYATQILKSVQVYANNSIFRTYKLTHLVDDLGYERVASVQEINSQNEVSNSVVFEYDTTPTSTTRMVKEYTNNLNFDQAQLAGDFDGDGRLDFVANDQLYKKIFNGNTNDPPINLPFNDWHFNRFAATTLTNNKLNQFQSLVNCNITTNNNVQTLEFKIYDLESNKFVYKYSKSLVVNSVDRSTFEDRSYGSGNNDYGSKCYEYYKNILPYSAAQKPSLISVNEGDFDGDGISELLINVVEETKNYTNNPPREPTPENFDNDNSNNCYITSESSFINKTYLLNLDPRVSSGAIEVSNNFRYLENVVKVADFNGDGKSDLLTIARYNNLENKYQIISFKQLTVYPWVELEVIGSGTLDKYSPYKQILFGDFNGDGKTDLMLPSSEGGSGQTEWNIYYSNPNPSGGEFFVKEIKNIVEYWPDTGTFFDSQRQFNTYYAIDINGDDKSDVVRIWRKYYKPKWTINDHNTQWRVTAFTNNIGKVGVAGFTQTYDSNKSNIILGQPAEFGSDSPDIPIPIVSNYRYNGANTDLVLVRGHNNKLEYYKFNKDLDTDNRLKSVSEANGNIKQTIAYKPMEAADYNYGNAATDFYSSSNSLVYPNIEVIRNSNSFLVSKLTATINGVSKYQDFRYRGYVSNFNYGTVGFLRTTRSSWHLSDSDTKIWTTQNNDVNLRGANTITWTSTSGTTVFNATPSNLLSAKTNVFSTYTNPTSNVYNILLDSQTSVDALSGVKSENIFTYDGIVSSATYYGLETKSISKQYSGSTLQGSVTVDSQYDSNPNGAGSAYYIGRPKKVNTSSNNVVSGDTRTSEEVYTYTGNNLTKTEKKGHNTYAIVEDMTYDALGNLLTKTVSAPAAPTPPAARKITDEYDATKRFVVKKTDHQNFITTFVYNTLGQLKQSKDYLGVTSDFVYDNWGKLTNTTVTGSTTVPLTTTVSYAKLGTGGYTVTTTNNLDAKTISEYDVLGRVVKSSTKGFGVNSMVSKQIVYDGLGRKQKESEPYFSSPSLWTSYEYDYLMRPTKITAPTGKVQSISYSVLTTTSNDDGKITTATVDALGNKVKSTDPGGTINFKYFANGQLKESDYAGNKVTIDIDGWGNKVKMTDPSAGIYTYSYDAFGQLKTETTPNGTTSLVYDAAGKTTEKTVVGTNASTNSKTTYVYNALSQITSSTFVDNKESKTTITAYEYDALKRLFKTTETTPYAIFIKQLGFDSLGRLEKETSTATAAGKSSSKTIKNIYQNGFPWQILDDGTQKVLWQTNSLNERGQLLTAAFGNGIALTNAYDQYGYVTQKKYDKTSPSVVNILTLNTAFEIKRGNLNSRSNSSFSRNETFKYDALDRLTEYTNLLGNQETQTYDDKGRITQNSIGTCEYDITKTYQNKSITPTPEAIGYYGAREGIFNDSMENRTGWSKGGYYPTLISFDNTISHTGKNSLKVSSVGKTVNYVQSDNFISIDNASDTKYTFSGWVYSDSPKSQLTIFTYLVPGQSTYTATSSVSTTVLNTWSYITKEITVPANIKVLNLRVDNVGTGNVWFDDVQIRKTSDASTPTRALNISYNTFKSPVEIEETGVDKISFTYNDGNDRSTMFYGGLQSDKLLRTYRKHYSADGTMEVKQNTVTGAIEFITYIGGDGYSAPVVVKSDGVTQNYLYLLRDYQGSILTISDQAGAVVEKRLFDAWGNIVKVQDGAGNILAGLTVLDRGYTGHEHLQSIGIIHMNGRFYDPKLHRFLQPDNYVQEPFNTQNYNRYAYVLNNPLKYTDPSGEEAISLGVAVIIGAIIAATTYTLTALLADVPFSVGGLTKSVFIGAASAAVTFGIGSAAGSLFTNFYSQASFQAVAHGTFQGGMTAVSGGKFWSGFAAGAISSIASSVWRGGSSFDGEGNAIANSGMKGIGSGTGDLGMIAFGTVSGGGGAALTGGNFWQGAVTGLVVSGLNHAMHKMQIDNEIFDDGPVDINSSEDLNKYIKGNKSLNKWYNKFTKKWSKFEISLSERFTGGPNGKSEGLTNYFVEQGYVTVTIFRAALQSYRYLFATVLHKFGHANGYFNGFYTSIKSKYNSNVANSLDEIYAHRFANQHGGVSLNTPYYKSSLDNLKDNKVNINTIKFPTYD